MPIARNIYRVMLGRKSMYAEQCRNEGWFGGGWGITQDLTNDLSESWRDFNKQFAPIYLAANPQKTKVAAGLACGMLHTICKGIELNDIILSPDGKGHYWAGKVTSPYYFVSGADLPHRRRIDWLPNLISRVDMSEPLRRSTGSIGTISNISKHADEIEAFLAGQPAPSIISTDELIEDASVFALEKHLEDFLIHNWAATPLGKQYDLFSEDGEVIGRQYPTDTGPIDILAVSKDGGELLVVELKRGRASDAVVGQIQRYMGYVIDELAEDSQKVRGCIIALEDDVKIKRALRAAVNIDFYRYEIAFKLFKAGLN